MSDEKIVGYWPSGEPIRETPVGAISTCAFMHCCKCLHTIKTTGGPSIDAQCVECYREKLESVGVTLGNGSLLVITYGYQLGIKDSKTNVITEIGPANCEFMDALSYAITRLRVHTKE